MEVSNRPVTYQPTRGHLILANLIALLRTYLLLTTSFSYELLPNVSSFDHFVKNTFISF